MKDNNIFVLELQINELNINRKFKFYLCNANEDLYKLKNLIYIINMASIFIIYFTTTFI